jgi:hypothetical protein
VVHASGVNSNGMTFTVQSTAGPIAFVQANSIVPQSPQTTVALAFAQAQTAGNLNVVAVGWSNNTSTVTSVTDSQGNPYFLAVGPTVQSGVQTHSIYYAANIVGAAAGANSVTVRFSAAAPFPDIRILEYSGISPANPVDVAAGASGSGTLGNSGNVTTTFPNDLLFGANVVTTGTSGPGANYTRRLLTGDGDIAEDQIVTALGTYSATAPINSGSWVMQVVAFRGASGAPPPPDTTPPTNPSGLNATPGANPQISLSWTASSDPDSPSITYHVERCQGSGCGSFAEIAAPTVTSFLDTGLSPSTSYSYRVRASDPSNNFSGYSNVASATTPAGPNPALIGQWASPFTWPMVGIHATLMPNGKVLTWEDENQSPAAQIWDPSTMTFTAVPYAAFDLFCSGHTVLPDGRIMVAGGHNGGNYMGLPALTFFNPTTKTWSAGPNMSFARWYPTVTALPDGRQMVTSGAINCENCNANTPEIYDPTANVWTKLTAATISLPIYPHMFVLPDGRILVTGSYELPVATQALDLKTLTWTTIDPNPIDGGSSVMYLPGKILKSGTSANSDPPFVNAVSDAYVLDMTQNFPTWRKITSMAFARSYHNLTSLPDGSILVTGGESNTNVTDLSTAVYAAEMWSPTTEQWTTMASMQSPRVYHSTALLLPDGRVLSAGSGEYGTNAFDQLNGEIYSPPYLFKGARPTITSAPTTIQYGQNFAIQTPDAATITSVSLIRLGSVTHAFNQNQKYIPLTFTAGSGTLTIGAPATVNLAPPGHYMLFILNSSGVPSVGAIMSLPVVSGGAGPTAPANLAGTATTGKVVLTWTASTSPLGIANYVVYRSTTSSFTPSSANQIATPTGTTYTDVNFTTSGTYYYYVAAQDAVGALSAPSNEAIETVSADVTPPAVSITAPANGATVSGNVTVTANASDDVAISSVQFQVDGTNIGSAITTPPYSILWNSSGVANGPHTLTAIATNGANLSTTSAGVGVTVSGAGPAHIAFVQVSSATPQTSQSTVAVTFSAPQVAGDLNVVVVAWSDSTSLVNSVTDSKGNNYIRAVGPTALVGLESQSIYYAANIAPAIANTNTVTVKFSAAVPFADIRILEYSGLDTMNPLDVSAAGFGSNTTSNSGTATTTSANDLIFGANYVTSSTSSAGTGFTSRVITTPDGDIAEDKIVTTTGSYNATANLQSSGSWIMQMVAFRAAGGGAVANPMSAPK